MVGMMTFFLGTGILGYIGITILSFVQLSETIFGIKIDF